MDLVLTVLGIIAPVFLLASIGFTWVKLGYDYRVEFVTRLVMTLSVPALIFTALMTTEIEPRALTTLLFASIAGYAGLSVAAVIAAKVFGLRLRTYVAPLTLGNTGNLGLPLALFAFGDSGLSYAVVVFAVMAIWSSTFGLWMVAGGGSPAKILKEPLIWGTLLGALFLWQGWQTPLFLTNTLELLGQIAIPIMLITLGVAVARMHPRGLSRALWLSVGRVALALAVSWSLGRAFGLDPEPFAVLVVQLTTPVAVMSYLMAEKYEAGADEVAALVVASTLLSVFTIPLILAFVI